jgi:hypothetical protein
MHKRKKSTLKSGRSGKTVRAGSRLLQSAFRKRERKEEGACQEISQENPQDKEDQAIEIVTSRSIAPN